MFKLLNFLREEKSDRFIQFVGSRINGSKLNTEMISSQYVANTVVKLTVKKDFNEQLAELIRT